MFVEVNCECYANAFVAKGGQIVVDVTSGTPSTAFAGFETYLEDIDLHMIARPVDSNSVEIARLGLPLIPSSAATNLQVEASDTKLANVRDENLASEEMPSTENNMAEVSTEVGVDRVKQTELALIEQLGRAAAQGLVDANLSTLEAEVQRVTQPIQKQETETKPRLPEALPVPNLDANQHIAIQTSIDREANARKSEVLSTQEGFACLPDSEYAIATWGGDIKHGGDLAKYKAAILGEFDRPEADALNAFLRHQIYLTFGAEAIATAGQFAEAVRRPDIIRQMAQIMDWHQATNFREISPQMGCDGKTALWAALAQPEFRTGQELNKRAIISSFSDLPLHLRRHLGPTLAQKFLDFGDADTAIALRNLMDRAEGDPGAGFEFLEARIDIENGNHDGAETTLTNIVNDDTELSPTAVLALVASKLSRDEPVSERMLGIISTFAYEQRDLPLGRELKVAEIQALASGADFRRAYSELEAAVSEGVFSKEQTQLLKSDVLARLLENGSDTSFLRYSVGGDGLANVLDKGLQTAVADRLTRLGFLDDARNVLDVEGTVPDVAQRIIYSKIALKEGKPNVALGYVAGLSGVEAERIQADAFLMSEEYETAAEIYQSLGDGELQQQAEMRGGAWGELSKHGPVALREMGQVMMASKKSQLPENTPPLAANRELLRDSAQTREVVRNLLEEFPSP